MATIEALATDITKLEVDAIANAANTDLAHGGGVAGAIVRAGGSSIQDESNALAPIELGAAVATGGRRPAVPLGDPRGDDAAWAARPRPRSSARRRPRPCSVADELGCRSLALVAFGTGVGGFPLAEAAAIEVEEVRRHLAAGSGLERVVFAVRGDDALAAFGRALAD